MNSHKWIKIQFLDHPQDLEKMLHLLFYLSLNLSWIKTDTEYTTMAESLAYKLWLISGLQKAKASYFRYTVNINNTTGVAETGHKQWLL